MMNKEEIDKELKKSRRQNKNDRYEYICKYFNPVNYAMTLEKYAINLHRKNIDLQQRISKAIEYIKDFEIQANHINDEIYLDETLSNKLLKILGGKE